MNTTDDTNAAPRGSELSERLVPELLPCRACGGKPYAYDMRGIMHEPACTVECGDCDNDSSGDTPEAAANDWNRRA